MIFLFFLTCAIVFVVLGERARYAREVTQAPGPSFEQMIGRSRRKGQALKVVVTCDTGNQ